MSVVILMNISLILSEGEESPKSRDILIALPFSVFLGRKELIIFASAKVRGGF